MADKGQTIASLYLSLGVDLSELDEGLALADRSVKDALAKLNSENRQIKIQADIDMAKLEGTGTVLDKIKVKYEAVTKQIGIQNQKTLILQRNLEQAQKSGAPDRVQSAAKRRLMEQQLNTAKMEAEQRRLSSILGMSGGTGNALGGLKDIALASREAGGGVSGLVESLASLHPQAASVAAALAVVVGVACKLKDAMMDAANAQAPVFELASRIGIATEEAQKLTAVASLAAGGGDAYAIHTWLSGLNKQILAAGESGNLATKTMEKFGVSLKDSEGKIVGESEALDRLAEGFKKAQAAGRIDEYAEGLGMKSEFLLDLMNKLESTYKPAAKSLEKSGIFNPEGAAELTDNVAKLEMHITRLKQSLGAAFIPVGNSIVPEITETVEKMNGIVYRMANWRESYFGPDTEAAAEREAEAAEKAAKREAALSEIRRKEEEQAERQLREDLNDIRLKYQASAQERELADLEKRKQAELAQIGEVAAERSRVEKKTAAEREEILAKYEKRRREMDTSLKDSILSVTGSDLENALRGIDRKAEELREKYKAEGGALTDESASLIDRNAEAQKAKVMENFERDTVSRINDIWRTGLEQRLAAIDREAEAWRKKGVDEAAATRWAEQAKADAIVNRNRAVMTQEREALNAYLTGGIKGLEAYQMKKDDYIGQLDVQTLNAFDAAKKAVLQKMYGGGLTGSAGGSDSGIGNLQAPMQTTADYTKAIYEYVAKGIVTDVKSLPTADLSNAINGSRSAWDSPEIQNYLRDGNAPGAVGGVADKGANMEIIRGTQSNLDAATRAMMNAGRDMEIIRGTRSSYDRLNEAGGRDGMAAVNQSLQGILARMDVNRSRPSNDVDITVNIDTAVTEDSASMAKLADAVADRITPKVEQALGGSGYGY